tara:strand:+ start:1879 stop:3735 length:1857 start_codon:yes stop_codon:yes gene_type:complete
MAQQFNTTELDFEKIKGNLISYFKRQDGPYKDYDFTGSGLNQLLDILAYNTHYNAVNAHMAMNESFLDSAQIRGNVVSRAKLLGYTPKSVTAPEATLSVTFTKKSGVTLNTLTLPKGTQFISQINDVTYTFETTETNVQQINATNSTFKFNSLKIKQGSSKVENYTVDNSYDQRFVINSQKADTSTLKVEVFPTLNAVPGTQEVYELFTEFPNIDGTSRIYYIDENADGNFEIRFGNNKFGKQPQASSLVRLTYLVSDGPATNGAKIFSYKAGQISNVQPNVIVATRIAAANGSVSENVNSIKYNAPLSFIAQERAVTSDDYKAIIMKNFSGIENVSAWGGETETPRQFGKVFISIKPTATAFLNVTQKQNILSLLEKKKVVGVTPVIVDPEYTFIYFQIFFKYDPADTANSVGGLSSLIKQTLIRYNAINLNNFDGVYRHSNLLSAIDSASPAILNTTARVFAYKNITITSSTQDSHKAEFGFQIDGRIDQTTPMMITSGIQINGQTNLLADEHIPGDSTKRRIYSFRVDELGNQIRTNNEVGFLYPFTGVVDLAALVNDNTENLKIKVRPASDDIISQKRKILQIDINETTILGDVDNISMAGSAGLSKYNTFNRD